jgi:hypothetical protein
MAIRVLDILNYSNRGNPLADSGVRLKKELISAILRHRSDFFFYLLVPSELLPAFEPEFRGKNVLLIPATFMSRQQGGAFHFNVPEITSLLDFKQIDVDLLFVNQPELTAPLLDLFNKVHFFDVHSFGCIHWMDWKKSDNVKNRWNQPANLSILSSILLSAITGCNSQYGKTRILKEASRWFNSTALEIMDRKLVPLWPGINTRDVIAARTSERFPVKTIIFPFRAQKYTGFKSLVEVHMANLWKRRKDFRLLLTNPSDYDYVKKYHGRFPFIEVCRLSRKDYLETLWKADIVVGCHNGSNQWSLAAVEAIAAECVPLLNQTSFFPEMILAATTKREEQTLLRKYVYYRGTFTKKLEALLDNLEEERAQIKSLSRKFRRFYNWDERVKDWIRCFELADAAAPQITERSKAIREIEALLKRNGKCTKESILRHLNWHPKSRQISWTKYRKYLRKTALEDLLSPVVTFSVKKAVKKKEHRGTPRC